MFFFFLGPDEIRRHMIEQFPYRQKVEEFVEVARMVDSTMSVGALATFVHIANRMPQMASGERSLRDIAAEMAVPYTSFTRQVDLLAAGSPPSVRGLGLLEKRVHPTQRRQRQVLVTDKGTLLLGKLSAVFGSAAESLDKTGAVAVAKPAKKVGVHRQEKP